MRFGARGFVNPSLDGGVLLVVLFRPRRRSNSAINVACLATMASNSRIRALLFFTIIQFQFFHAFSARRDLFPFPVVCGVVDWLDVLPSPVPTRHPIGAMEVGHVPPALVVTPTRQDHAEAPA